VEIDQYNEQAWLWLSAVVDSPEEQRTCLENVLAINPANERARQGLDILSKKGGTTPQMTGPTPSDEDVLASSVISQSGEELPTSIDWADTPSPPVTATSSSSAYYHIAEPSAQEYDSWVANLGLGSSAEKTDDPVTPPAQPASLTATFLEDDEELFGLDTASVFTDEPERPSKPATSPPPAKPAPAKVMSPAPKPVPSSPKSRDSLLDEIDEDDDLIADLDEDYDEARLDKLEPEEMFRYIPKEIKATRLPGTRERYPLPVLIGFIAVILLNIGALAFLASQLSAANGG
jgi:hypothetical protein